MSSHHLQEVPLAQFSLYVLIGALSPPTFHSISNLTNVYRRIYMYSITLTQFNFCVADTNSRGWKFQFDILAMERWRPKCGYFPWFGTVCLMNDLGRQLITWMRNLSFPTKAMRFWMDCKRLVIWESFLDLQINWAIWDAPVSCSSATIQGKGGGVYRRRDPTANADRCTHVGVMLDQHYTNVGTAARGRRDDIKMWKVYCTSTGGVITW